MKSGKYTLGYKTCLKTLRSGKGELKPVSQLSQFLVCGFLLIEQDGIIASTSNWHGDVFYTP